MHIYFLQMAPAEVTLSSCGDSVNHCSPSPISMMTVVVLRHSGAGTGLVSLESQAIVWGSLVLNGSSEPALETQPLLGHSLERSLRTPWRTS